jgi:POT family proton-dependent oligopeptide transporter
VFRRVTAAEATPSLDIETAESLAGDRAFLGHPKGLGYLAFTEAWERFSFYGMQALLVLYMVKALLLPDRAGHVWGIEQLRALFGGIDGQPFASAIFGTYAAGVYLTPILGGLLADRVLGTRRTLLLGGLTMAVGHFLMAFDATFLIALACLILGVGMFKGNIASQVGALYREGDTRRADAFQIFYLGINAGVIASPLIVGSLGENVGWHWGFAAAGVGMVIAVLTFLAGTRHLPPEPPRGRKDKAALPPMNRQERMATLALILLVPVMAIALVPNMQIFNAYMVWGDRDFDLVWLGTKLPTTWLVTLDSVVSVSFLALTAVFYRWYAKHRREPDELAKMIIGSAFSLAGMLALYMAAATKPAGGAIGLAWPITFHVLNSIGFAHVLPVSLALFARLAPKQINATVIGLYYLAFFGGNALVGWIGGWFETMRVTDFWLLHAGFAAAGGAVFVLFKLLLAPRLMHEAAPQQVALG